MEIWVNNQQFPCLQQFTYYPLTDSTPNIKEYFQIFDLEYPCQKNALSTQQHDWDTCSSNYVHIQLVMLIMMWTHKIVEKQSKMSWSMSNIFEGKMWQKANSISSSMKKVSIAFSIQPHMGCLNCCQNLVVPCNFIFYKKILQV